MDNLTAHRMLLLRAVVRTGSFSKAAEQEGMTVSAISQHMSALERALGLALFERHSRGVTPTEAGVVAGTHADDIHDSLVAFEHRIDEVKRGEIGVLVCGIFPTLATSLGPALLNSPRRSPGLQLSLRSARLDTLRTMLRQRDVDVALTWSYPWSAAAEGPFEHRPVMRDSTVLLVPQFKAGTRWNDYMNADTAWVTRSEHHQIGSVLEWAGREFSFTPHVVYAANDWAEAQGMVEAGLGVALAPALATIPLRPGVAALQFPMAPVRTIFLTRRKGQPQHPGEEILIQRLFDAEDELPQLQQF